MRSRLQTKATSFLGGGNITRALVSGLRLAGHKLPIVVYDRNPEKLQALKREFRIEPAPDVASAVALAEMLVIAVRPASVKEMLAEVGSCGVPPPPLCLSLAAGIPFRNLRRWLNSSVHWARAMPSPVCRIGRGLSPVSFDRNITQAERVRVRAFFQRVGTVIDLPERQIDAITATHSPTHGYHAVATLAKAAEKAGLAPKTALIAATHALGEGIAYWSASGETLGALLHEAATPGGIAAATMAAMDRSGYARAVSEGLKAGMRRARRNAKL